MKKLVSVALIALVSVALWTLPALAGPKALSEAELDATTAAGQPTIVFASSLSTTSGIQSAGNATLGSTTDVFLTLGGGQQNLRALVLNNVVGENELATALNIQSSQTQAGGQGAGQDNKITQSWGSTLDWGSSVTAAKSAIDCSGNNSCEKIIINKGSAAPGVIKVLSMYSDEIVVGNNAEVNATKQYNLTFDVGAQDNVAALAVNNVSGLNMVATAINVQSGDIRVNAGANTPLDVSRVLAGPALGSQANTINQFRGTPFSRPAN